jgi:hypothetical protein
VHAYNLRLRKEDGEFLASLGRTVSPYGKKERGKGEKRREEQKKDKEKSKNSFFFK